MAPIELKPAQSSSALAEPEVKAKPFVSVRNVLFATDFSATSDAALPYAAAICRRFGSTLHAVHVLSEASLLMMTGGVDYVSMGTIYEDAINEARERLDHICDRLEVIPHRSYVRHGQVWKTLESIIHENEIDLIVLGTHGRTGLGKLLLGSVAEDILRHAECPVLTIGPKVSGHAKLPAIADGLDLAPFELEIRQIVCATNFGKNSEVVVDAATSLAEEFRARLTLMHVIEDYSPVGQQNGTIEAGMRRLQELIHPGAALQYPPEFLLDFGSAPERVLKAVTDREADMVVLGARSSAEIGSSHFPWSSAHHVIAQAHCPVLTIRE
ncbi:MAG TPA: universal stress protein [Candidatus Sulfotelmatobacter sp.]|nr:universal stress protein [Candidatus Sulfotelmatobacter sp.]